MTLLMLFSTLLIVWGQKSKQDILYNSFFITNGDTVRYHSEYDWYSSDVDWLMNERTRLYALVDTNLNVLTEFRYRGVTPFYEGFYCAAAKRDGKWGLVNKKGEEVTDFEYSLDPFPCLDTTINKEFFIFEKKENKKGVIDANGEIIVPFKWKDIFYCNCAILSLKRGRKNYLYYVKTGKTVQLKKKFFVNGFNKFGKAVLDDNKTGKYGVIDTSGTIIQPCIYNREKDVEKFLK